MNQFFESLYLHLWLVFHVLPDSFCLLLLVELAYIVFDPVDQVLS